MKRIQPLDGLRAFAVLGVIWAHIWMFFGNPSYKLAGININQLLSFGGIGVDLFFVISGFCMYLMHSKQTERFSASVYKVFIVKRWKRIAPAFYFIVLLESVSYFFSNGSFPIKSFFYHIFFINTFNTENVLSPPFWSLATEWHFYLILPFLFINDFTGKLLVKRVTLLILICLFFRLWLYHQYDLSKGETIVSDRIWYRFAEFGFGILAARFYLQQKKLPAVLTGNFGFLFTLCIAFGGRLLMTTEASRKFGSFGFFSRAMAEPLLTFGFAIMILNLLDSDSVFRRIISSKFFLLIGKVSYSMYLWHWLIAAELSYFIIRVHGISELNMMVAFIITIALLLPISLISYKIFEAPYFKKREQPAKKLFWV